MMCRGADQLLLVLALLSAVVDTESADGIDCDRLSAVSNCSCNNSTSSYCQLECPSGAKIDISFVVDVIFFDLVCTPSTNMSLLMDDLSGLRVGDVHRIKLSGCSLSNVSIKDIMSKAGIEYSQILIIDNNFNATFQKENFVNLFFISVLLLTNNDLTRIPLDIFEGLGNLKWLEMEHNIIDLPEVIFSNTPNLSYISLNNNSFTAQLKAGVIEKLKYLDDFILTNNRMMNTIKAASSTTNEYMEEFTMEENENNTITLPLGLFSNMPLKSINIKGCNVMLLPENSFWGSANISNLILKQSMLKNVSAKTFRDLRLLKYLDLSKNRISYLPEGLFSNTDILQNLNLSENNITHLPEGLFSNTPSLRFLKLNNNRITELPSDFFTYIYKLEYLYLGFNHIYKIDRFSVFTSYYLKVIDISNNNLSTLNGTPWPFTIEKVILSNNSLTTLQEDWLNVKQLDLSFNNIQSLQINTKNPPNRFYVHLNLTNNNISRIDVQLSSVRGVDDNGYSRMLHLENNPLNCDCKLLPFIQLYSHKHPTQNTHLKFIQIPHSSELKCSKPKQLSNMKLSEVAYSSLTCDLSHSVNYTCPTNCSCEYRPTDQGNIVTCQDAGLTQLPEHLTVNSAANHTELNIVGNHLEQLQLPSSNGYDNVTHWRLSDNGIEVIRIAEALVDKLELLDISCNNLTRLSADTMQLITAATKLNTIVLHGNPWKCDCDSTLLRTLLSVKYTKVTDIKKVTCSDGRPIIDLEESDLCPPPFFKTNIFVVVCLISAVLGLMVSTVTVLYFKYQQQIRIYCFSSRWRALRWLVSRPDADEGKKYDAFISYAHQDESFVTDRLVPYLEQGETKFKVCLHYRDWTPGESIQLQILKSIKESRRTIVVLSPSYLASDWGRMEFTAAYDEALQDGKTRVVVIMYQDVGPIDQLDDRIRIHLQVNTYLEWGSRWFWQQLNFAMPHPSEAHNDVICVFCPQANRNQRDDILEEEMLSIN